MAHDLHFNNESNKYSFFSVKEKPWHGLGQILDGYPTSGEAIKLAGLDYEVVKTPVFIQADHSRIDNSVIGNSASQIVPDYFATKRMDTGAPLGVVGKDYQIVQNRDAFSFFDSIVQGDGILYETAGALGKNGERIFITAKLPGYIRVGKNDMIERYLFLTNSHDGSGSITAAFTPIRVVCRNTLNAAMRNLTNVVRIRHTANAKLRLEQAHKVMGMACTFSQEIEPVFNQWAKVRITDKELKTLIEMAMAPNREVLGKLKDSRVEELSSHYTNMVESVYEYALSSPTQNMDTTGGTVFGSYNAITGYFQNVRSYKDQEAKVKSILLAGTAQLRGQTAFNLCEGFARHGADIFNMN